MINRSIDQSINLVYFHYGQYMLHQIKINMNEWRRTKETFTGLITKKYQIYSVSGIII